MAGTAEEFARSAAPSLTRSPAANLQQFLSTLLGQVANGPWTGPAQLALLQWQKPPKAGLGGRNLEEGDWRDKTGPPLRLPAHGHFHATF